MFLSYLIYLDFHQLIPVVLKWILNGNTAQWLRCQRATSKQEFVLYHGGPLLEQEDTEARWAVMLYLKMVNRTAERMRV